METTVRQLINRKGHSIWSIQQNKTVFEALELMAEKEIGALLIFDGEQMVGIFSERDYARKVILQGRSSETTRVEQIMSTEIVTAAPEQTVKECMTVMTEKRIRHLPVVADDRVVGLISIGDLVQAIISDQQQAIEQLENYISG